MRNRNYQEDFNQNRSQRRKKTTGVIALGLAGVLVLGSLFAYFSDMLTGEGFVQTGTLNIKPISSDEGYTISVWTDGKLGTNPNGSPKDGSADKNDKIEENELTEYTYNKENNDGMVLNPGDMIVVTGDVKNDGSKSAWLQSNLELEFIAKKVSTGMTDPEPADVTELNDAITVYREDAATKVVDLNSGTKNQIKDEIPGSKPILSIVNDGLIINGTVEKETATGAIGETYYTETLLIFGMDKTAGNRLQGLEINVNHTWKALQYRNNTTEPIDWSVVSEAVGSITSD